MQTEIIKSLDRLKVFASKANPLDAIAPFYHAANTLLKYADGQKDVRKKQKYFEEFYDEFERFARSDFSKLKKHHEQILDEIAQIIQSEAFIQCLRPDLHNIRHLRNSLRIEKIETIQSELDASKDSWSSKNSPMKKSGFSYVDEIKSQESKESKEDLTQNKLDQLYKSIKKSYEDHCLDDAYTKIQEYLSLVQSPSQISPQKSLFIKNVSDEYETMTQFYEQFDKGEWTLDKEQNGITLEYKIYEVENMIAIRINGEGEIPIEPFMSIISEIDLMGDYVPFCYDCKEIKKISRNERMGHSKIYIPLLKDRETFFYAAGYDRIKTHKSLFFFSKTINEDLIYQKKYNFKVPPEDKYIRLEYKFFIIEYIPMGNKKARIRLASKIDMKMDFVPKFILFKSARIFAFDYFKNIIDRIKGFKGSKWEQKIKDNPEMYRFFKKKLDEHLLK